MITKTYFFLSIKTQHVCFDIKSVGRHEIKLDKKCFRFVLFAKEYNVFKNIVELLCRGDWALLADLEK